MVTIRLGFQIRTKITTMLSFVDELWFQRRSGFLCGSYLGCQIGSKISMMVDVGAVVVEIVW
jgi:hypothetical protein